MTEAEKKHLDTLDAYNQFKFAIEHQEEYSVTVYLNNGEFLFGTVKYISPPEVPKDIQKIRIETPDDDICYGLMEHIIAWKFFKKSIRYGWGDDDDDDD